MLIHSGYIAPYLIHTLDDRRAVSNIALVNAERARQIEDILCRMAQTGTLRGKVTEGQLIELMTQVCFMPFGMATAILIENWPDGRSSVQDNHEEDNNRGKFFQRIPFCGIH